MARGRDEVGTSRDMSSASEVGTDDGTATTKNPKDPIFCVK